MKIIISHDVDHISVWEHWHNLIIPKFIMRGLIEYWLRYISLGELKCRFKSILQNRWQNLEELMHFDKAHSVPSTFFVGVGNGMGLTYSLKNAKVWIRKIQREGFDVGVHGIAFDDGKAIEEELEIFRKISGCDNFGIRIHYIRMAPKTLSLLNRAGYLFDSSLYKLRNPFRVGDLWEFPLHVMDGTIINAGRSRQSIRLDQAKDVAIREIGKAYKKRIRYLTILSHDRYFHDSFTTWKQWYVWLIGYLKRRDLELVSYRSAIKELDKKLNS